MDTKETSRITRSIVFVSKFGSHGPHYTEEEINLLRPLGIEIPYNSF
jgi:tRNA nucleotidyltransferase/poly(A) polymerase